MTYVTEPKGTLIEPEFHDGLLLGIILSEERGDLTLICKRVDGKEFSVVVPKIVRLRVDNFLQGNIIFGISIHEGAGCSVERVRRLHDFNDEEVQRFLPTRMKEITDSGWTLLEVSTSYGCELVALSKGHADEITVSERYLVP